MLNRYSFALAALLAAGAVLHLVPAIGGDGRFVAEWFNIGHVAGFALLSYLLVRLLERWLGRGAALAYPAAAVIALALGVAAEAAQLAGPRDASWSDIFRDAAGIAGGLLAAFAVRATSGQRAARAGRTAAASSGASARDVATWPVAALTPAAWIAAALAVAAGAADPGATLLAHGLAHARFPQLARFETPLDLRLAQPLSSRLSFVAAPPGWPSGGRVARIEPAGARRYEGVSLYGWPGDWSSYEALAFTISADAATGSPVNITLRIHDAAHDDRYEDRFNRRIAAVSAPREVRIPLAQIRRAPRGRPLDLSRVVDATFFVDGRAGGVSAGAATASAPAAARFHIGELRLE